MYDVIYLIAVQAEDKLWEDDKTHFLYGEVFTDVEKAAKYSSKILEELGFKPNPVPRKTDFDENTGDHVVTYYEGEGYTLEIHEFPIC